MKLFPLNKNSIALLMVTAIAFGFFFSGLLDILDYFIVKALLFASTAALVVAAMYFTLKNE